MSLIHALVARGTTVLAEHATGTAELKPGEQDLNTTTSAPRSPIPHSRTDHHPIQDPTQQLQTHMYVSP